MSTQYRRRNDLVAYQAPDGSFVVRERPYQPRRPRVRNHIIIKGLPEGSPYHDARLNLFAALINFAANQRRR